LQGFFNQRDFPKILYYQRGHKCVFAKLEKEAILMVKIKKRNGRIEEFVESKIVTGVKKAGANAEEAARVAKEVAEKIAHRTEVTAEELSNMVVTSLRKFNKAAADEFEKFRDRKLKAKKKKT
jgi:transcriptional regulator NrdR family protein